jgi:quinolinate synthase
MCPQVLSEKRIGVVAHFYMDAQVQGVLTSAAAQWRHIHISDSLVMADSAVAMAAAGCTAVAVLGVDFMSENVRAILDEAGYPNVAVYRMAAADIGCSLAEAAETPAYSAYLGAQRLVPALFICCHASAVPCNDIPLAGCLMPPSRRTGPLELSGHGCM